MNKQIKLTFKGKDYTLEYNRNSIKQIEAEGFSINSFADKPAIMLPLAFKGAFLSKHRYLRQEIIDEIYDNLSNKQNMITVLSQMIGDCYSSLMGNIENNDDEGNAQWEIVG